jgi:hypothetical protein
MAMEKILKDVTPTKSVTFTVKLNVPLVVGVPLSTPPLELRVTPGGSWPAIIDQV